MKRRRGVRTLPAAYAPLPNWTPQYFFLTDSLLAWYVPASWLRFVDQRGGLFARLLKDNDQKGLAPTARLLAICNTRLGSHCNLQSHCAAEAARKGQTSRQSERSSCWHAFRSNLTFDGNDTDNRTQRVVSNELLRFQATPSDGDRLAGRREPLAFRLGWRTLEKKTW